MTAAQAAAARGLSEAAARSWAWRRGVAFARPRPLAARNARWRECVARGLTAAQAAAEMGVRPKAALQWAARNGLRFAPARPPVRGRRRVVARPGLTGARQRLLARLTAQERADVDLLRRKMNWGYARALVSVRRHDLAAEWPG